MPRTWLKRTGMGGLMAALALLSARPVSGQQAESGRPVGESQSAGVEAPAPTLPPDVVWETNDDDPLIGSLDAIRGGTFNYWIGEYPLTFRLMGPNSNDAFAAWKRAFSMLPLVARHPITDDFIPLLATAWSVQDDQRTIYFKLDPDARWSDGEPVTADDYVFTWRMMQSEYIVDPFYNSYAEQYYESVDKIDDYTLRIVGTRPSWRPLVDYGELWPTPAHATVLDDDWVTRTNNEFPVAVGPYVISQVERGESVTFERVPDWWGDGKRYFIGQYNFDQIHLRVIPVERTLDYLRRGEIDMDTETTARTWNEEYTFDAVRNGWLHRARIFVDMPSGVYGLAMNLEAPIFQNKDFRKAMQYLFNFDRLNRNLMFGEYFRQNSFFEGSEFANPDVKAYPFDPVTAEQYLERAGYHRPAAIHSESLLGSLWNVLRGLILTRKDDADILVNDRGEKASFTLTYGSPGLTRHLTVMQQEYRRAGVEIRLQLLEPGTAFERTLERKYEMALVSYTTSFYPAVRQYLHSEFKATTNNNDIWGFGTAQVDSLIAIYEDSLNADARLQAMYKIDEIVHDEAFYIPFWEAPYTRLAYWDYMQFPDFYFPKRTQPNSVTDWMVYWIDPDRRARLQQAMSRDEALPVDPEIDKDPWGIKARFQ